MNWKFKNSKYKVLVFIPLYRDGFQSRV